MQYNSVINISGRLQLLQLSRNSYWPQWSAELSHSYSLAIS